jgi:hypothetical protein
MSRWISLALTSVSVLALATVTAPDSESVADYSPSSRVGNWCC